MDILLFIVAAVIYIMVIHFALEIKNEFNIFLMAGYFILGGFIGLIMHSFETGFVIGVILSLLFW